MLDLQFWKVFGVSGGGLALKAKMMMATVKMEACIFHSSCPLGGTLGDSLSWAHHLHGELGELGPEEGQIDFEKSDLFVFHKGQRDWHEDRLEKTGPNSHHNSPLKMEQVLNARAKGTKLRRKERNKYS